MAELLLGEECFLIDGTKKLLLDQNLAPKDWNQVTLEDIKFLVDTKEGIWNNVKAGAPDGLEHFFMKCTCPKIIVGRGIATLAAMIPKQGVHLDDNITTVIVKLTGWHIKGHADCLILARLAPDEIHRIS